MRNTLRPQKPVLHPFILAMSQFLKYASLIRWTATGTAARDRYIVTNQHVVLLLLVMELSVAKVLYMISITEEFTV